MTKEEVFKIIEGIVNEKLEAKKRPLIVLFIELERVVGKLPLEILKELYTELRIDFGRTVNHNYIEIRTNPEKRKRKVDLHKIYQHDEKD